MVFFQVILTCIAFAGNSVLCKLVLKGELLGPQEFTTIRLGSGALALALFLLFTQPSLFRSIKLKPLNWAGSLSLWLYALTFSLGYLQVSTGTGALILFGMVQITLVGWDLFQGKRFQIFEHLGLLIASLGLLVLTYPHLDGPSMTGLLFMAISGVAWGVYTRLGSQFKDPVTTTSIHFALSLPWIALSLIFIPWEGSITTSGIILGVCSGVITSAMGYVLWYHILPTISTSQAVAAQLSVPMIATLGGILFLQEGVSIEFVASSILVLSGIGLINLKKFHISHKGPKRH